MNKLEISLLLQRDLLYVYNLLLNSIKQEIEDIKFFVQDCIEKTLHNSL